MRLMRAIIFVLFAAVLGVWGYFQVINKFVKDTTPPKIISDSDELVLSIKDDEKELLKGLTAKDSRDGNLTSQILVGTHTKFISDGVFKVTYLVFDSSNNVAEYTRRVEYKDYTEPVFTLKKPLVFRTGEKVSMFPSIKITDCLDGDITSKAKIISNNIDSTTPGTYYVTFQAANSYADVITQEVPVNIVSSEDDAPEIELKNALVYLKKGAKFDPKSYLKGVKDKFDTEIDLNKVEIVSSVDTKAPGMSQVKYSYTNSKGIIGQTFLTVVVKEGN